MKLYNKSDVITYFTTPYIYIKKSALSSVCAETLLILIWKFTAYTCSAIGCQHDKS